MKGRPETTEGYRTYLGLQPRVLPYVEREAHQAGGVRAVRPVEGKLHVAARLFEGFTSYYDDLMLVRSGLMSQDEYFAALGRTVGGVLRGTGRLKQSVAESSFDAWIKYYRCDENATNAIVSYYTKGSLVALAFDLAIRAQTRNKKSLDDVMRLWQRYGRDFYRGKQAGVEENEVEALIEEATGVALGRLFADAVHGTRDLPLAELLAPFGVTLAPDVANGAIAKPTIGARLRGGADCTFAAVYEGGAAHRAGLSAGDTLIAVDGLRVTGTNLDALLARYRPGDKVEVHAFRRDELRTAKLKLDGPEVTRYRLTAAAKPAAVSKAREAWLKG